MLVPGVVNRMKLTQKSIELNRLIGVLLVVYSNIIELSLIKFGYQTQSNLIDAVGLI